MNRREFLRQVVAGGGGVAVASLLNGIHASAEETAGPPNRPNIIIVLADDMGWRDTSYQGSPVVKTPALDDIAAKGVRFDYFYAAQQMCSPGRFGILTGRTPFRTGLHHLGAMRPQEITLAEVLKTVGYHTGHFGKWHLGGKDTHPIHKGFDLSYYSPNYFDIGGKLAINDTRETVEVKGDSSVFTMDLAIDWIRKVSKDPKPFFAYVCFGSPHSPHKGAPEFLEKYRDQPRADFWAELAGIDAAVGKLRDELRKLGIADNTILWFTSDNGGITPQSMDPSSKGKGNVGVRTAACMEWPGRIKQPIRTDAVCAHMDMAPTLLDITGQRFPDARPIDGISLLPLLEGKLKQRPKPVGFMLWEGNGPEFAKADFVKDAQGVWIDGQYKVIHTPAGMQAGKRGVKAEEGDQLYDIYADPAEKTNLAPKMPEQVTRMRQAMTQWQKSVRDSFDGKDYARR